MKKEEIAHLAKLARIALTAEEEKALAEDVTGVLDYVGQVQEIAGEEPVKEVGALFNVMREDEPTHEPGEFTDVLLEAAPDRKGNHVRVKKVLDDK